MSKGIMRCIIAGEMDNRLRRLFEIMTIELSWLRIIFREKENPARGIVGEDPQPRLLAGRGLERFDSYREPDPAQVCIQI